MFWLRGPNWADRSDLHGYRNSSASVNLVRRYDRRLSPFDELRMPSLQCGIAYGSTNWLDLLRLRIAVDRRERMRMNQRAAVFVRFDRGEDILERRERISSGGA